MLICANPLEWVEWHILKSVINNAVNCNDKYVI